MTFTRRGIYSAYSSYSIILCERCTDIVVRYFNIVKPDDISTPTFTTLTLNRECKVCGQYKKCFKLNTFKREIIHPVIQIVADALNYSICTMCKGYENFGYIIGPKKCKALKYKDQSISKKNNLYYRDTTMVRECKYFRAVDTVCEFCIMLANTYGSDTSIEVSSEFKILL